MTLNDRNEIGAEQSGDRAILFEDGQLLLEIDGDATPVASPRDLIDVLAVAWTEDGDRAYIAALYDARCELLKGESTDLAEDAWGLFVLEANEATDATRAPTLTLLAPWLSKFASDEERRLAATGDALAAPEQHLFDDGLPLELILNPVGTRLFWLHDGGLTPPWWTIGALDLFTGSKVSYELDLQEPVEVQVPHVLSGLNFNKDGSRLYFIRNGRDAGEPSTIMSLKIAGNAGIEALSDLDADELVEAMRLKNDLREHGTIPARGDGELASADDYTIDE